VSTEVAFKGVGPKYAELLRKAQLDSTDTLATFAGREDQLLQSLASAKEPAGVQQLPSIRQLRNWTELAGKVPGATLTARLPGKPIIGP
jgi:hypothetical protein